MNYDVFISHASADKAVFVDKLANELSSLDLDVFYDDFSILWGDNIKSKIDDALNKCKKAIIVISENYFGREWTEYEINMLLIRQRNTIQPFIYPVLLNITKKELVTHYPELSSVKFKYAKSQSVEKLAREFKKIVKGKIDE